MKKRRWAGLIFAGLFLLIFAGFLKRPGYMLGIPNEESIPRCVERDIYAGHRYRPGCEELLAKSGHTTLMAYNDNGLRDRNYSKKPKPGCKRVLVLGPSALVGPGLEESVAPPRLYEKLLRKHFGPRIEVINGAVMGYTAAQVAIVLPKLLAAYAPTHVLFFTSFSNISMRDAMISSDLVWQDGRPTRLALDRWHAKFSATFHYMNERLGRSIRCSFVAEEELPNCLLGASFQNLEYIARTAKNAGAKFSLLLKARPVNNNIIIPPNWDLRVVRILDFLTPYVEAPLALAEKVLRAREIAYVAFNLSTDTSLIFPDDNHLNAEGAQVWANVAYEATKSLLETN